MSGYSVHADTDSDSDTSTATHSTTSFDSHIDAPNVCPRLDRVGNFALLASHKLDSASITVRKWESTKSGLKVVWADTPSLVSTFAATVVTEAFDDSGCAHTREHLSFIYSEHFPYSSVLFSLAGRQLSDGANAYTMTDNTTYTLEAASPEGMLTVLPCYLDHIFFPVITPEIFTTEIYHVNGQGKEGGTVFSEMQGRESTPGDVLALAESRALYRQGNAYRQQTGGLLDSLRKLTLQQIVDFHRANYVPQNVTIVVTGRLIDPVELLLTIDRTIERSLARAGLARGPHPRNWTRPFVESSSARVPPTTGAGHVPMRVSWPGITASEGEVWMTWVGPALRDVQLLAAIDVLGDYLVTSRDAVLLKEFVENPSPACAGMDFQVFYRDPTVFRLTLGAVGQDRLDTLAEEVKSTLVQLGRRPIDMKAIKVVLTQQRVALERTIETKPGAYIEEVLKTDISYGAEDGSSMASAFDDFERLDELEKWTQNDWTHVLNEWLVERHPVVVVGSPSSELGKARSLEDKARVQENVRKYGREGLARLDEQLKRAKEINAHPAPESFLARFSAPDLGKIAWLSVGTARSNGTAQEGHTQEIIDSERCELPFSVQFDDIESEFVAVSVFLHGGTSPVASLFVDSFFTMPVETATHRMLERDEVARELTAGFSDTRAIILHEGIFISLIALKEKYASAITWLSDILHGTIFDPERLKVLVHDKMAALRQISEDGYKVAVAAAGLICTSQSSFQRTKNRLEQLQVYSELKKRLDEDPQSVIRDLRKFRKSLLNHRSMRFSVVGDIESIEQPVRTWKKCFESPVKPLEGQDVAVPVVVPRDLLSPLGRSPARVALVYKLENSESSWLVARSRCPKWDDPDYAALIVASAALSRTDGLIWEATRTTGLCYGAWVGIQESLGLMTLDIFRSPNAMAALKAIRELVLSIVEGRATVTDSDLVSSRSSVAFELIARESTPDKAASSLFEKTVLLNKPRDFCSQLLEQIQLVTAQDVHRVVARWISPLCSSSTSIVAAASGPSQNASIAQGLTSLGYTVQETRL